MPTETALTAFSTPHVASALLVAFVDSFGGSPLFGTDDERWTPQAVELELRDAGVVPQPANMDKLFAAAEIITTDNFERSLPDFIRLCNILADSPTDGSFDPAEAHEIAWALVEHAILSGAEEPIQLAPEIVGYVQQMLEQVGATTTPPIFRKVLPATVTWNTPDAITDDPEMFAAVQGAASGRVAEMDEYVCSRFTRLLSEIADLPLQTKHAQAWRTRVAEHVGKALKL